MDHIFKRAGRKNPSCKVLLSILNSEREQRFADPAVRSSSLNRRKQIQHLANVAFVISKPLWCFVTCKEKSQVKNWQRSDYILRYPAFQNTCSDLQLGSCVYPTICMWISSQVSLFAEQGEAWKWLNQAEFLKNSCLLPPSTQYTTRLAMK